MLRRKFKLWGASAVIIGQIISVSILCGEPLKFGRSDSLEEIRAKITHNGYNFTVGETWVYKLSQAEKDRMFKRRPADAIPPCPFRAAGTAEIDAAFGADTLPTEFDWRDQGGKSYIGAVRNQGTCGSCYAFAACAAAESSYNIANNLTDGDCADFSESYIAWCLGSLNGYKSDFYGCDGAGYNMTELRALTKLGDYPEYDGAAWESDCPYSQSEINASNYLGKIDTILFDSWSRIYPADYDDTTEYIKKAIQTYGVVDAAVLTSSAFDAYTSGIYEDSNTTPTANPYYNQNTDHMISLVGWDDNSRDPKGGYWILRNSWGESWGEEGYMRIYYKCAFVNCNGNYMVYSDTPSQATLTVNASPAIGGSTNPSGASTINTNTATAITANPGALYNFAYWEAGTGATIDDPTSASTTVTITANAEITAHFVLKAGTDVSLTLTASPTVAGALTPSTPTTVTAGDSTEITATPADGYTFDNWESDDDCYIADSDSAATSVILSGDATITAVFSAVDTITIGMFKMSLDNIKDDKDSISISKAEYPSSSPTGVTSAVITIDDYTFPACDGTNGEWKTNAKGTKLTYKSNTGPKIKMTIDTDKGEWSFKVSKAEFDEYIDPTDGFEITLKVNGSTIGMTTLTYEQTEIKTKIKYKTDN